MDPQELRGLMEAYAEVYAPIEELYKGKHGQSETEYMDSRSDAGKQISGTSKLSGAAYSHRSYKGVGGPAKPGQRQQHQGKMTPADRNELAIRKANLKKEELEQVGEAVKGESSERRKDLAAERKAGHRPLPAKEGEKYASYKMSQMAYAKRKRMGEEVSVFDVVLEFLQAEGFAETLEEAEWLMANVIDEEAIAIIVEAMHGEEEDDEDEKEMKKGKKSKKSEEDDDEEDEEELDEASYSAKAARAGKDIGKPGKAFAKIAKSAAKRYGSKERGEKVAGAVLAKLRKEGFEKWLDEAMTNYEKNRKRAAQRAAARNAARDQGKTGAVPGVGYVTPRREKETWTDESGKTRHAKGL
jgi:hypothetical protein